MKKFFLCAAVAMLALVGCEKQNQSSLDFDQVEKAATVSGTLVAYVNNPKTATATLPLEGIRLYISVPSDKYVDGAAGIQEFETKTAADGSFSITIKTGSKTIQGAKLRSDDFKYGFPTGDTLYYQFVDVALDDLNDKDIRLEYVVAKEDQVLNQTVGEGQIKGILTYDAGTVEMPDKSHENAQVAAANALMEAVVTYFKGDTKNEVKKKFVATTNAQGEFTFNIPAQSAGNEFDINVPQFKGKYTEFKNNQWVTVDAYYTKEKLVTGKKVMPAETLQLKPVETQLVAADRTEMEPTTKDQVKLKVQGKIVKEVEKKTQVKVGDEYHESGIESGTAVYVGPFVIEMYNSKLGKSIIYDAETAEDGTYGMEDKPKEYAIYDNWDIDDVEVRVHIQGKFVDKISHYYLGYTLEEGYYKVKVTSFYGTFAPSTDAANMTASQSLEGTYQNPDVYDAVAAKWIPDGYASAKPNLFFTVKVPDLVLQFQPADKTIIRGLDASDPEKNKDVDEQELVKFEDKDTQKKTKVTCYDNAMKPSIWKENH